VGAIVKIILLLIFFYLRIFYQQLPQSIAKKCIFSGWF